MGKYVMLAGLAWYSLQLAGQPPQLAFRQYPAEPRLAQTTVSWITEDKDGFLWLATESGLFRFDGYAFKGYKANPHVPGSLPHNLLLSAHSDRQGYLWIGSFNGLIRYDPYLEKFTSHRPDPRPEVGTKRNFVHRIAANRRGGFWVGTQDGLFTFEPATGQFGRVAGGGLGGDRVRALLADRSGNAWVGTERGLCRLDGRTGAVTRYRHDPGNADSPGHDVIRSLCEDRAGNLWIGTEGGLDRLDPHCGRFTRYRHRPGDPRSLGSDTVLSLLEDRNGQLWVGTYRGLSLLDPARGHFTTHQHDPANPAGLGSNMVTALYADAAGGIWIGTNRGINRVAADRQPFGLFFNNGQCSKSVTPTVMALAEAGDDAYWIGTVNHIVRYDRRSGRCRYVPLTVPGRNCTVFAIARDTAGTFWLGTSAGLFAYDPARNRTTNLTHLVGEEVWDIHPERGGTVWLGTINGLCRYDPAAGRLVRFGRRSGPPGAAHDFSIGTIVPGRGHALWIGTARGGLKKFDKRTGGCVTYRHRPGVAGSLSSNTVTVVHEDRAGVLWIGTANGLNRFLPDKNRFVYLPDAHYDLQEVEGILEDDHGNLWINYPEGICKYNPATGTRRYYDVRDGLQKTYTVGNHLRNPRGELLFPGSDGITIFHPDSIRDNGAAPRVVLTDFAVFNKPVLPGGDLLARSIAHTPEITLSHEQFIFSFGFTALNFVNPEKTQYAYRLEGFEADWNYAGARRFASYSNIPAGRSYRFRVKATTNDGVWDGRETVLRLYIRPPYWETGWFRSVAAGLLAALAVGGHKLRVREYKRQRAKLERQVAERTAEIRRQKEQIEGQARQIARFNELLRQDNEKLEENVKDLSQARVMQKRVTFEEFRQIYPDEEACLRFLAGLKWDGGYACTKCGNTNFSHGPVPYARRCSRCSSVERATSGTIFSRVKMPITKAFYMLFLLNQGKELTVDELSGLLDHPRQTCWAFRKKVLELLNAKKDARKHQDGWSHLVILPETE